MPMKGESWLTEGVGPHPNSLLPAKGDDTTGTCPPQPAHLSPLQISPRQAYAAAAQKALHCKHKPRAHRPGKWPQETLTHNTYEGQGTYGAFQRLLKSSLVQHFLGSSLNTHTHTQKFDIKGLPPLANIVSSSAKTPQPLQPGSAQGMFSVHTAPLPASPWVSSCVSTHSQWSFFLGLYIRGARICLNNPPLPVMEPRPQRSSTEPKFKHCLPLSCPSHNSPGLL